MTDSISAERSLETNAVFTFWDEVKLLQDTYMKMWAMFMSWFTWFYNINLLALSWVLTSNSHDLRSQLVIPFVMLMEFCIAGGAIATVTMFVYRANVERRVGCASACWSSGATAP